MGQVRARWVHIESNEYHSKVSTFLCAAPWAPYWEHVNEGWNSRHEPNILFIFYEEMKKVRVSLDVNLIESKVKFAFRTCQQ